MKKHCIFLYLLLCTLSVFSQDSWDVNYRYTTIDQIIRDIGTGLTTVENNYTGLFGEKYKIQMRFEGVIQSLDNKDREFMNGWVRSFQLPANYSTLFSHKILCSRNEKRHWIFVQNQSVEYYRNELSRRDNVYLYVMFLGSIITNGEKRYVVVANEFRKVE